MDEIMLKLWAKKTGTENVVRYPLMFHMIDVAAVTQTLWDMAIQKDTRRFLAQQLNIEEDHARDWLAFWCGLHDIGKAIPAFQGKDKDSRMQLEQGGLDFDCTYSDTHHSIATSLIVSWLLEKESHLPAKLTQRVATTIAGHHGLFPRPGDLPKLNYLGNSQWRDKWQKLASALKKCLHLDVARVHKSETTPAHGFFLILAGLTSVADWIASNEEWFPYSVQHSTSDEHFEYARARASEIVRNRLIWEIPSPRPVGDFSAYFGFNEERPLQSEVKRLASKLGGHHGLVIIEAPMGEGKTEAALYLADSWLASLGQKGCYFALPTQATSDQMFGRVKAFLQRRYQGHNVDLMLLHGHASLHNEFNRLLRQNYAVFSSIDSDRPNCYYDGAAGSVLAAEWFTYRRRGLLAPFGVGTIDQALLAVLQTKHFFVRLFGLAGKTVVIDEVHAYDAYMVTLLENLLSWLAALGSTVVVLSATLPQERRKALLNAYSLGLSQSDGRQSLKIPDDVKYPRITWLSSVDAGATPVSVSISSRKNVRLVWLGGENQANTVAHELGDRLQQALAHGGCAAVICNTVDCTQQVYLALKKYFPEMADDGSPELDILHARYLFGERQRRERRTLLRFSKQGSTVDCGEEGMVRVLRPKRAVLVATQIIEQSLDLDFDLLVTEMAPVDLILQRAGRLQRHGHTRPVCFQDRPELWIVAPDLDGSGIPTFGNGTEAVYDYHILLRSWLALKDRDTLSIPDDIEPLIEQVYNSQELPPPTLPPGIQARWQESLKKLERERKEYQYLAQKNQILPPTYHDDILAEFNKDLEEEDDPKLQRSIQALTRIVEEPSVRVLCLYGDLKQPRFSPTSGVGLDLATSPDDIGVRMLLSRSVTISHRGLAPEIREHAPPCYEQWRKNPLLRHHYLLFFDDRGTCSLVNYRLHIDDELGIVIEKLSHEGAR